MSRRKLMPIAGVLWTLTALACAIPADAGDRPIAIVIHGGAGVIERAGMTPEHEASFRAGLAAALDADDPQFNAGRGAVLDEDGFAELDAAIMDGNGPRAGAVGALHHVKNPIELARLVMDKSPHVLMVGQGAEEFALEQNVVLVPESHFVVPHRVQELAEAKRAAAARAKVHEEIHDKLQRTGGTGGVIAMDPAGNIAMDFNTPGMFRALSDSRGRREIGMYSELQ